MEESDRAIGRIEGRLESLIKSVEKQTEQIETLSSDAKDHKVDLKDVKTKLEAATPILSEISRWRERFIGMMILTSAVFTAFGVTLAMVWHWIAVKFGFI